MWRTQYRFFKWDVICAPSLLEAYYASSHTDTPSMLGLAKVSFKEP